MKRFLLSLCALTCIAAFAPAAQPLVADNGFGTAAMPILADYPSINPMVISSGLPPGATIVINATLESPLVSAEQPGGLLGGTMSAGGGPVFTWNMQGTGSLAGYNRTLVMPGTAGPGGVASFADPAFNVIGSSFEVHSAPRTLTAPVQTYNTDMERLFSQIAGVGDPDFDLLRVVAGTQFGLPSPGQTKLTQVGANWNVESNYNLTYRIDFVGNPAGPFAGRSGSTTGTSLFQIGMQVPEPATFALAVPALIVACFAWRRRRMVACM